MPTRDEVRVVLADHYLSWVQCDPESARDKPHCACSLVDLGWHPSVGDARDAWVEHVLALFAAEPGVAVPEPDEQRCEHGFTQRHRASGVLEKGRATYEICPGPNERLCSIHGTPVRRGYCTWLNRPAASPVAQEDQP